MKKIALGLALLMPCITFQEAFCQEKNSEYFQSQNDNFILAPTKKIKVLISHDKKQVQLNINGKYRIFDPYAKKHISTRFKGKNQIIESMHDGLKWGEEFPGLHQLEFVPGDTETTVSVDGVAYKGNIIVYDIGGSISVVNELLVEDYLFSHLSATQIRQLPGEIQAALAIAARTNAYYQIHNPKNPFWDIDARAVGYRGLINENLFPILQRAIKNTKDMVLSLSGKFEGTIITFPIEWENILSDSNSKKKATKSMLSLNEANDMVKQGEHADFILKKAFPQASLHLISND